MSRSGYSEDGDQWATIKWRGAVAAAMRGKRGQAFLLELVRALDEMPEKRLIANDLIRDGQVCALGCVGAKRGIDLGKLDPEDYGAIAEVFGIARPLVREIEWMNDDAAPRNDTPERRWQRMRDWAVASLLPVEL